MKRALILHGWTETPESHWYQDEVDFLTELGYKTEAPLMPDNLLPNENTWLKVIEDFSPDEESILVGHSLGGTTILEYLEKATQKVDKVLLAAAPIQYSEKLNLHEPHAFKLYAQSISIECFLDLCGYKEIYDWKKIRENANSFHLVYIDNDSRVPLDEGKALAKFLKGSLQVIEGNDHCDLVDINELNAGLI